MTTTRFPSRDGLVLGLLYLVLGFVSVFLLTLTGLPVAAASLVAIVGFAVVCFLVVVAGAIRRSVAS
jgi:hypothetical protein